MSEQYIPWMFFGSFAALGAFSYWGTRSPENYRKYLNISVIASFVGIGVAVSVIVEGLI